MKKVNPFNVFNVRRAEFPPDHFEYVVIAMHYNMRSSIEKWIEHHLSSRFFIGKISATDAQNKITNRIKIGFEDPKEMSLFMMACPHLKY
jgi:hypothetical protein